MMQKFAVLNSIWNYTTSEQTFLSKAVIYTWNYTFQSVETTQPRTKNSLNKSI